VSPAPLYKLGDTLRQARERKGLDFAAVERDTKIRARYLSALERGDYHDLPGAVYARGFVRNYGQYLGLDPEYLLDLYRLEADGLEPATPRRLPQPIVTRARAFVITPSALLAATLTVLVAIFVVYLGSQLATFARTPELRIIDPEGDVLDHPELTYTVRGVTEPNSRIAVDGLRENPEARADETGAFEVTVKLVPGRNLVSFVASDPRTGRDSAPVTRTITVATGPLPAASLMPLTELAVSSPEEGSTIASPVAVAGTTSAPAVSVTPTAVEAASNTFTIRDAAGQPVAEPSGPPPAPPGVELPAAEGVFGGSLTLPPGIWELAFLAAGGGGDATAVRRVTVTERAGLGVRLEIRGGESFLELSADGTANEQHSGSIAVDGTNIDLAAERTITIRAGNAGAVSVIVNEIRIGTMGDAGAVVEWTVSRD
jgi:transcriptional regulator with XRE-family HTH domain